MAKRKQTAETEDLLSQAAPHPGPLPEERVKPLAGPVSVPAVLEYMPLASGEKWRVEKFDLLSAEVLTDPPPHVGSYEEMMTQFHEMAQSASRGWLVCRRLFGIGPMIPPANASIEDLRPNSREEVCAQLGITTKELQAELDTMRVRWTDTLRRAAPIEAPDAPSAPPVEKDGQSTLDTGDDILREFGFSERMFEMMTHNPSTETGEKRASDLNRTERNWFVERLRAWSRMLSDVTSGALAREALMNELYLKRFAEEMSVLGPSSPKWKQLYDSKKQIEQIFNEQLKSLQEMFPEMATAGKESFRFVVSTLKQAHQDYYGHADRRLVDKLFTVSEIEVLLRQSQQREDPQYRFGLSVAIAECTHNLWNPDFRPQFKPSTLKKLDAGFREAVKAQREALAEPLIDLEKGVMPGEGDDYPDLKKAEG